MDDKSVRKQKMKIAEESFNGCPGRKKLAEALVGTEIEVVDLLTRDDWQNKEDTLVLSVDRRSGLDIAFAMKLGVVWGADELNYAVNHDRIIIRMWWD